MPEEKIGKAVLVRYTTQESVVDYLRTLILSHQLSPGERLVQNELAEELLAVLTTSYGRHRFLPWGAAGGQGGSPNGAAVIPKGAVEPVAWRGKLTRYPLRRGDRARLITGTGGGYGNPLERPVERVQDDVKNGYVTLAQAEQLYGVTLDPTTLEVLEPDA